MITTFDEFKAFYFEYGKTPNMMGKPKHTLNEKELLVKWKSYQKANIQKEFEVDEEWEALKIFIHARDKSCRFLQRLRLERPNDYKYMLQNYPPDLLSTYDLAHVIRRSKSKKLYYDKENIVLLCRAVHSNLDSYHHPITGVVISKTEVVDWWQWIIGEELFDKLQKNM